jgi:hypothetical protein
MNQVFKAIGSTITIAALTACGGGGGDSGGSTVKYTQADIKNTATLGVLTSVVSGDKVGAAMAFLGGVIQGFSTDPGGSRSVPAASCASGGAGGGSLTASVTKTAVRTGLAVGDSISYTFANCVFGSSGLTFNGTVKLTAQTEAINLDSANYQVSYQAGMTGFSMKSGTTTANFGGTANVVSSLTSNTTSSGTFTVPTGQTFSAVVTGGSSGPFSMDFAAGTTFTGTEVSSPNTATRKLDGTVNVGTTGAAVPLVITTPAALSGTTTSGLFVGTFGVVNTKASNLATSVSISGTNASVSGDTDGNGSLDLVFSTTWTALTTQ